MGVRNGGCSQPDPGFSPGLMTAGGCVDVGSDVFVRHLNRVIEQHYRVKAYDFESKGKVGFGE